MKIVSYNVNGIRSAIQKGFYNWLDEVNPDIVCLQEIKASPDQIGLIDLESRGYHHYWYPAQKKGYSGVAIFSKIKADHVVYGCGIEKYDIEGRVLRIDIGNLSVLSTYHPSGSSGEERQAFKMEWLEDYLNFLKNLKSERPYFIASGDYNICHKAIDIHNPKSNANTSGFLPEEREWFDRLIDSGYVDTFRYFNDQPNQYSWWSYRANARSKNLGWRIDYHIATENLKNHLVSSVIMPEAVHSDHCPVILDLDFGL